MSDGGQEVYAIAEWLYERDWKSRVWRGDEEMRPRPTFAELLTGETVRLAEYRRHEIAEGQRRLGEASRLLDIIDDIRRPE